MTRLTKAVRRKVDGVERGGLVVTLYPNQTIGLRAARTRREHVVTLGRVYRLACEVTIEADRQAKQRARDEARRAKGLPPRRRLVSRSVLR